MLLSLIGSHGTGKTSVFKVLKEKHPEWQYFTEGVRHQVPAFGYQSPYDLVADHGICVFEIMNINSWSVIDSRVNPLIGSNMPIITDRSAVDNLAYFLTEKRTQRDEVVEPLVRAMAQHYASLVDRFVYFPVGVFPLVGDEMRKSDLTHQMDVDQNVVRALQELNISEVKVHLLQAKSIEERVEEIERLIIIY